MTKAAAIAAKLVDVRNVALHKCVRLTVEVPAEEAMAVIHAFGWPTNVDPVDVAIARINLNVGAVAPHEEAGIEVSGHVPASSPKLNGSGTSSPSEEAAGRSRQDRGEADRPFKPRKPVAADKKLAQQAGICCSEPAFQRFLAETGLAPDMTEHDAADCVRDFCGVVSRSEIAPGSRAAELWIDLHGRYQAWKLVPA